MIRKYYLNIKNARLIIKNVLYDDLCSNLNIENVDWLTLRFRNGEKETERKTTWNFAEVFFDCFFSHIRRWRGYNLSNNIIECHLKNYLLNDILWFALDFIQVSQSFLLVSNRKKKFRFLSIFICFKFNAKYRFMFLWTPSVFPG